MKKRFSGIMTLLVGIVLAFTLVGCEDVLGEGTKNGIGWPPSSVLKKYDVGNLTAPSGSNFYYIEAQESDIWVLTINFTPDSKTLSTLTSKFKPTEWAKDVVGENTWTKGTTTVKYYDTGKLVITTGYL